MLHQTTSQYYQRRLSRQALTCACGNLAIKISKNAPVCQRCLNIEARMEKEDWHLGLCGIKLPAFAEGEVA